MAQEYFLVYQNSKGNTSTSKKHTKYKHISSPPLYV